MRRMIIAGSALASALVLAAGAHAQDTTISAGLTPNTAGAGSTLRVDVSGTAPELSGALPQAVVLDVQRGFAIDLAAVAARCQGAAVTSGACPGPSSIGGGQAVVHAGGFVNADIPATIDLFLADPAQAGDLASVVLRLSAVGKTGVIRARLLKLATGPVGYELRVDGFAATVPSIPGITLQLKSLTLQVGARRTVTKTVVKRVRVTRRGKRVTVRRKVRRRVRHDLIRNPKTCTTAWGVRATLRVADVDQTRELAVPCAPAS